MNTTQLQPNELRVGSIVLYNGQPNKVVSIRQPEPTPDRFKDKWIVEINHPDSFWVCLDEIEAAVVDDIWLKRGEFVHHSFHNFWRKNWGRNGVEIVTRQPDGWMFELGAGYLRYFQYVHELQNIFFALTGTEIEFDFRKE